MKRSITVIIDCIDIDFVLDEDFSDLDIASNRSDV